MLIPVSKGADYLEVHPTTLSSHKAAGWSECDPREPVELSISEIRDALTAKGIEFPDGAKKAELRSLLNSL